MGNNLNPEILNPTTYLGKLSPDLAELSFFFYIGRLIAQGADIVCDACFCLLHHYCVICCKHVFPLYSSFEDL